MENLMNGIKYLMANWQEILGAFSALLTGVIAICMLIPGEQPEKTLNKIVDWIKKFSKK